MSSEQTLRAVGEGGVLQPRESARAKWRTLALGSLIILLAAFAVYWPALSGQFLWDDLFVVQRNPLVTGQLGFGSVWFRTDFPLSNVAFWLEWLAWGNHPVGYHVVNVLLHATGAVLLWRVLARLKVPGAWLAAMIFTVHPLCVASVAWISELKNTLSLPFFLLSLLWYLKAEAEVQGGPPGDGHARGNDDPANKRTPHPALSPSEGETGPSGGWVRKEVHGKSFKGAVAKWYSLSLAAFVLALLSKTSTVMLPIVLLACAWWRHGRIGRRDWLRASPFFALALVFGVMSIGFQVHGAMAGVAVQREGFWGRLAGAGMALWFYLGRAVAPLRLSMIYPRWKIEAASASSYLPLLLWCGALAVCWAERRSWGRHLLFGLGCFTAMLFPVLGFFDMYYLALSRVSDHFVYLPLTALVALAAAGLGYWWSISEQQRADLEPRTSNSGHPMPPVWGDTGWWRFSGFMARTGVLGLAGGGLVVVLAVLAMLRAHVFINGETLWRDTLAKNPRAWCAHANLGSILASKQKYDEARKHLETSLKLNPENAQAHSNLGRVLAIQRQFAEADLEFQAAVRLKPKDSEIRRSYAAALAGQGRQAEAVQQLRELLELTPDNEARSQLATLLYQTGQFGDAVAEYRQLLAAKPDQPEALSNLAWLLATSPDSATRNGTDAVRFAEQACRLTGYQRAQTVSALAAAYAEAGRFTDAVEAAQKAIELARTGGNARFAAVNEQLLSLYRAGKPYHMPSPTVTRPGVQ